MPDTIDLVSYECALRRLHELMMVKEPASEETAFLLTALDERIPAVNRTLKDGVGTFGLP